MTQGHFRFRQIVFELREGRFDPQAARLAADFAALTGLDLSGRVVGDPSLGRLAELPFAREFHPGARSWHRFDASRLGEARALALAAARRALAKAASEAGRQVTVTEAPSEVDRESRDQSEEIVVISPAIADEEPLSRVLDTILGRAGAALLLPRRPGRRQGPVAVVATTPDDPVVATATEIADMVGEALLPLGLMTNEPHQLATATRERLIVLRRGVVDDAALTAMVTRKSVPLLVLRPG